MPSLKEIRGRINSVNATLKITDVTRMISSAKLHKAQGTLNSFLPYKNKVSSIFYNLANSLPELNIPLLQNNEVKKAVIVAFSSNTGLAGAFNINVIKRTTELIENYRKQQYNVVLYTIGKKVYDGFAAYKDITLKDFSSVFEDPTYANVSVIADELMNMFLTAEVGEIVIVYNRFKNILTQYISDKKLLPVSIPAPDEELTTDFILEPSEKNIVEILAPQVVRLELFESLLESLTAEFGARSSAMQAATDNASELINELTIQYNKVRQSAITGELIDIVGGSEALR